MAKNQQQQMERTKERMNALARSRIDASKDRLEQRCPTGESKEAELELEQMPAGLAVRWKEELRQNEAQKASL